MGNDCEEIKKTNSTIENSTIKHGFDCRYRRILWVILLINLSMFVVEVIFGFFSRSPSLLADALDFFGDAAHYAISLYVFNYPVSFRARVSIVKGATMGLFGLWVLGSTVYKVFEVGVPKAEVMGIVGFLALIANVISAILLYKYRSGDSNRESVWICSRNDAIGNIAVLFAAGGVLITGTKWPDLFVAFIIASLALNGSWQIIHSARRELRA